MTTLTSPTVLPSPCKEKIVTARSKYVSTLSEKVSKPPNIYVVKIVENKSRKFESQKQKDSTN